MIGLILALTLRAEGPVCKDPCWNGCKEAKKACIDICKLEFEGKKKEQKTCLKQCEFDEGACTSNCPDVKGCDLE